MLKITTKGRNMLIRTPIKMNNQGKLLNDSKIKEFTLIRYIILERSNEKILLKRTYFAAVSSPSSTSIFSCFTGIFDCNGASRKRSLPSLFVGKIKSAANML